MAANDVSVPAVFGDLFAEPRGSYRFRVMHGGRGSGKSYTMALMALIWGYQQPMRILCTREVQASIKESMHAELRGIIESVDWLGDHYEVLESTIRGVNGTEFIFRGLYNNANTIKSLAGVDLCVVEEAQDIPHRSWDILLPTIRKEGSEIWIAYNPASPDDAVDVRFRQRESDDILIVEANYYDNPWFPDALEKQRVMDMETMTADEYAWTWEGAYLLRSEAQVFEDKYRVDEFEPQNNWDGPYQGLDWGFARDPTVATRLWIHDDRLFVEYEAGSVGLELDDTPSFVLSRIPDFDRYVARADNARPETISYVNRHGLPLVKACVKWSGSVEDGVQFIRSFREVVIHPRCRETLKEFALYSYKTNKAGDILPAIEDKHNHYIDSIRYALEPNIRNRAEAVLAWV